MTAFEELEAKLNVEANTTFAKVLESIADEIICGDDTYMLPEDVQEAMIIERFYKVFQYRR